MIDRFEGKNRWLSNFYKSDVLFEGLTYPSIEHAYQAAKFTDSDKRERISEMKTPQEAKKAGRTKAFFRPDWDSIKLSVMKGLVQRKFHPGSELSVKLIDTGDQELVEGNWWKDTFWGVCKGKGENWLGRLLMEQREFLLHSVGRLGG